MKFLTTTATALALSVTATAGFAACDDGEIVVKFAHVTNTDKHPKGIAASLLEQRVNELCADVLGYRGFVMNPVADGNPVRANYESSVVPRYLNNRAASIFGGSAQIQRNIVAKLVLGL